MIPNAPPAVDDVVKEPSQERASLDRAMVRGLAWFTTVKWGGQMLTWGSTIIIARLLTPEDFGVVAAAMVLTGFIDLAKELGLGSAIVQAPRLELRQAEQSMAFSILLAIAGAGLLVMVAPVWAEVQGDPRLVAVLRVLGVGSILSGVATVPHALLSRALRFEALASLSLLRGITTAVMGLVLAYLWRSYWALIAGYLAGMAVVTTGYLVLQFVRLRVPRWNVIGKLMRFGLPVTASRFFWTFRMSIDIMLIGGLLGARLLGLYSMGMNLARLPVVKISDVITPVLFPVFSRSQASRDGLHRQYGQTLAGLALIVFPAGFGLAAVAGEVVPTVLGSQWLEITPIVGIVAVGAPFTLLSSVNLTVLNSIGRVGLSLLISAASVVAVPAAILVGLPWGIVGVASAVVASNLLLVPVYFGVTSRVIEYPLGEYRRIFATPVLGAAVMLAFVFFVHLAVGPRIPTVALLLLKVGVGVVVYGLWIRWRDPTLVDRLIRRIRPALVQDDDLHSDHLTPSVVRDCEEAR